MIRFDEFVSGIWDGTVLNDVEFELLERDRDGNIITVKYQGGLDAGAFSKLGSGLMGWMQPIRYGLLVVLCTLHNCLLDIDGLDEVWKDGVLVECRSDWTCDLGLHDFEGVDERVPNGLASLSRNLDSRNYDPSGMGPDEDDLNQHPVDVDLAPVLAQDEVNVNSSSVRV
ncbi:hypothetical protein ACHAWF_000550, partial [Thalassiosira exigua]